MKSTIQSFAALLVLALVLALSPSPARADAIRWQTAAGTGTNHLYDVIYGGGRFVAVGAGGTILTSPDGVKWTRQVSGTNWTLRKAAFGNGQFVIAARNDSTGAQAVLTSTDASTWTTRPFGGNPEPVTGIAYGNGRFVFVGGRYGITSTTDFVTWQTSAYTPANAAWTLRDVAYGNGQFVAVGSRWITSRDGLRWDDLAPYASGRAITFMAGRFFAQGGYISSPMCTPELSTSNDGTHWYCRGSNPPFPGQTWNSVAFGGRHFVFAGAWQTNTERFQGLIGSDDAETWTPAPQAGELTKVVYGAQHFVAVGMNGTIVHSQTFPRPPIPDWNLKTVQTVVPAQFRDLAATHWAYKQISLITSAGVMVGSPYIDPNAGELSSGSVFRPDDPVTRAEFLVMLLRAYPFSGYVPAGEPFADVPRGHWAYEAIHQARYERIVTGSDNLFHPDAPITRAEMATLLGRRLPLEEPAEAISFVDIPPAYGWARPHIEKFAAYGIVTGLPDGSFQPARTATRAEAAALLSRLYR